MPVSYSIKINFDKNEKAPERVFHAMALYVEGFNELQSAFIKGYSANLAITSSLEATREGSCIADIYHIVRDNSQRIEVQHLLDGIYRGIRNEIATAEVIDCAQDIRDFTEKVHQIAAETAPEYTLCARHGGANPLLVADALHKIYKAKRYISAKDSVQLGLLNKEFVDLSLNFSCPRNGEKIYEHIESTEAVDEILIVRRPAYVDGLKWEFTNPKTNKTLSALMSVSEWLSEWRANKVQLKPGAALQVNVIYTVKTNLIKQAIRSIETEVIKVVRVIEAGELASLSLEQELGLDET